MLALIVCFIFLMYSIIPSSTVGFRNCPFKNYSTYTPYSAKCFWMVHSPFKPKLHHGCLTDIICGELLTDKNDSLMPAKGRYQMFGCIFSRSDTYMLHHFFLKIFSLLSLTFLLQMQFFVLHFFTNILHSSYLKFNKCLY